MKLRGTIIEGKKEGSKIGFPTANINIAKNIAPGIYEGSALVNEKKYRAAIYIGALRPHVLEAHLLDFDGNIYDKDLEVEIGNKIREDIQGLSLEELKLLIASDIKKIRGSSQLETRN